MNRRFRRLGNRGGCGGGGRLAAARALRRRTLLRAVPVLVVLAACLVTAANFSLGVRNSVNAARLSLLSARLD